MKKNILFGFFVLTILSNSIHAQSLSFTKEFIVSTKNNTITYKYLFYVDKKLMANEIRNEEYGLIEKYGTIPDGVFKWFLK